MCDPPAAGGMAASGRLAASGATGTEKAIVPQNVPVEIGGLNAQREFTVAFTS